MTEAPIPLHYTEALVRAAVRAWWWHGKRWLFWAAAAGGAAALALLLWRDPTGVWTLSVGVLAVLAAAVSAAAYVVPLRRSLRTVRAMDGGDAALRLSADGFEVESAAGRAAVSWAAVAAVVRTPEAWLLVYSRSAFSTLPLADLSDDARSFIAERVRTAGGRAAG